MSKYNFVKNCDIPEPPQSPIVVPDDSPINPLISLPTNPTIPLELIAKFLPCKYPGRYPCPEIKVENLNDQPDSPDSVTYNCQGKSELIVDFDIESYCCDVVEDEDGNPVDHDIIRLTSRSELTLPYPPLITSGALYYFDANQVNNYITTWNANHTYKLSACDRCWESQHLTDLRALPLIIRRSHWFVYAFNDSPVPYSNRHYLYPLVNTNGNYIQTRYAFKTGERIIASLDRCTCKATVISRFNDGQAVMGFVRGTCTKSYAEVTRPTDNIDNEDNVIYSDPEDHFWGIEPDYPVEVGAKFTGYLSKNDNKVYANVPEAKEKKYTGVGTYAGNGYVENIAWDEGDEDDDPVLVSTARIDKYNTAEDEYPIGAKVALEKKCDTCGGTETNTATNSEYERVLPAAAAENSNQLGSLFQVTLYTMNGQAPVAGNLVRAYNYVGPVQMGDRGMVAFSGGKYHFFRKNPDDEEKPGPVIHEGLRKPFKELNGFEVAKKKIKQLELDSLTTTEKELLILDNEYSTIKDISVKGTAEICRCTGEFTEDRTGKSPSYSCDYWVKQEIVGEPYNYPISYVLEGANYVICYSDNVSKKVDKPGTVKKKELHITIEPTEQNPDPDPAYTTVPNVEYSGLLYNGDRIYGPWDGNYQFGYGSNYYWSGHYGPLGVLCGSRSASLELAPLTGGPANHYNGSYEAHDTSNSNGTMDNSTLKFKFYYNPIVGGFETSSDIMANSYEVKSDGLYLRELPKRYYTLQGSTSLVNTSSVGDTATVNFIDLLKGTTYRVKDTSSGWHIYPGTLILKGHAELKPKKSSSEETYYYVPSTDQNLSTNITFTFTMQNLQNRSYTPMDIFSQRTGGWFQYKNLVFKSNNDSNYVVIDKNSFGTLPFVQNFAEKRLYWWEPDINLWDAEYTFKEFMKDSNEFAENGNTITISLVNRFYPWYPVVYDSNLGKYRLTIDNSDTSCYALYSEPDIPLDQTIHFTFTKGQPQDVDATVTMSDALYVRESVFYKRVDGEDRIYTKPNTRYYWTCPNTTINCDVEPKLPPLTVKFVSNAKAFTGYCWLVKDQDDDDETTTEEPGTSNEQGSGNEQGQ